MATPNKYQPAVNMPENVAAAYWQGSVTRAEVQKVFDEYAQAISQQAIAITKLDMCLAYLCEKFGVKPEDVQKWAEEKASLAATNAENQSAIIPASA